MDASMTKAPKPTSGAPKPAPKPAPKTPAPKAVPRARAAAGKSSPGAKPATGPQIAVVAAVTPAPVPAGIAILKPLQDVRDDAPALRRKDFLQRVIAASGVKKKDAQTVVEATLKVLGEALSKGESLALPPFGKARVSRQVDTNGGEMLVIKLRRGGTPKPGKGKKSADESLADTDD
ncbi:MAG: hypothetical protein CVT82_03850 [Alphaproteobacteria bacterium HGW-Alphaproteobacteria-4]|jgi:DNA-binding protein HU-alpha|nr:MAG: hypothetical protein CVT82_03850 [Alphaproteobacteria bacterium HGW-Alphaproteobacteria-4]